MRFDIDAILAKSDLLAYVQRAGGELKGGGSRYSCACPLHGGENPTAFSLYFKDGRWLWNCFTGDCGGGDAIRFVEKWQRFTESERDGKRLSVFQQACEWINGGGIEDAEGMKVSAEQRLEQARIELEAAKEREEARRRELQVAEKHLYYHKTMSEWMREKWRDAGVDDGMQDFWTLGGCDDFPYRYEDVFYHSPTLTIPIFDEYMELLTIQHRLLNPKNPHDKYRPEKTGLHAHPFLAMPTLGYDGDYVLVMEGSKKAMVSWSKMKGASQAIGVPSQEGYKALVETLRPVGKRVVVIPDPNSERNKNSLAKAYYLAKEVGGKFLQTPMQIDDYILASGMDSNMFYRMVRQARRA